MRQLIGSVNDALKGELDLEQHVGRTFEGVGVRVAQRILAMTCAIWHNRAIGAPVPRSLIKDWLQELVRGPPLPTALNSACPSDATDLDCTGWA
ncbi:hypothetical protein OOT09_18355 [Streptomyces sp. NBC_00199]|nr:hypothetical protein [Streptomyces sp. NBC_00199]